MEWFIAAVAVVALGVAAVVAAGGGGAMPRDPVRDTYAMALSEEPLDAGAVRGLRFGVALRGYAMDQVDAVLDRLAAELDARDARIAELTTAETRPVHEEVETQAHPAFVTQEPATESWEQPR